MAAAATAAKGTQLQIGDGATPTEAFLTVARLTSIGGVEITRDTEDATAHDSPGGVEEVIAMLRRTGEMPIEGQAKASDAGQLALLANLMESDDPANFRVVYPNGKRWAISAYVVNFKYGEAPVNGILGFSASLKPTGVPVLENVPA